MNSYLYRAGLLLAAATVSTVAAAQNAPVGTPGEEAPEPLPLYRVEVIVFANNEADPGEEYFRRSSERSAAREVVSGAPDSFNFEALAAERGWPIGQELEPSNTGGERGERGGRFGLEPEDGERADGGRRGDAFEQQDGAGAADGAARTGIGADPDGGGGAGEGDAGAGAGAGEVGAAGGGVSPGPGADGAVAPGAEATAGAVLPGAMPFGGQPDIATAPFRFRLLNPEELRLANVYARLERLDAYTPLVHGGWIQEGLPENDAHPFNLAYLGAANPAGTIQLRLSRFLHVSVDLDYRPFTPRPISSGDGGPRPGEGGLASPGIGGRNVEPAFPAGEAARAGDGVSGRSGDVTAPAGGFGPRRLGAVSLSEVTYAPRYTLDAERRIRSGDVNYFDHPFFGVIVVVEPYERPAPVQEGSSAGIRPAA